MVMDELERFSPTSYPQAVNLSMETDYGNARIFS